MPWTRRGAIVAGLAVMADAAGSASAAQPASEILAAGAAQHVLAAVLAAWPGPGPTPTAAYDTVGAQRDRVLREGARPAVAVLSAAAAEALRRAGLATGNAVPLGRTGVGLGARDASTLPAITGTEELREVLERAGSVGWADPARGATAGRVFERALADLGIALGERGRVFPFGVEAVAAAARGEVEVAVSQGTELHGRPGVRFLGYLPESLQEWTGYSAVAVTAGQRAEAILAALAGPVGRAALRDAGFLD